MLPALSLALRRRAASAGGLRFWLAVGVIALLHFAAVILLFWSEIRAWPQVAYLLTWGFLNFTWLALLRRPALAAALSLAVISLIIMASRFKHDVLFMTANFVDVMIIDEDTVSFLLAVVPNLGVTVAIAAVLAALLLWLTWRLDHFRVRSRTAAAGSALCLGGLAALSFGVPLDPDEKFLSENYVSKFARSATIAVTDLITRGVLESDAAVTERLRVTGDEICAPKGRLPNIVMVLDESSFDIRIVPGVKVPPGYGRHFRSFDGRARTMLAEGAGGPTWFTEYNVLSGLSSRSYGRFADSVTRIASGRVERGLPQALRRCGYRTFSLYPWMGNFLAARGFQTTTGIEHFFDSKYLGTLDRQPDSFYFGKAAELIARERGKAPLFVLVYTMANHFPWWERFRPDLGAGWKAPGNDEETDEYLRRQHLSEVDYAEFRTRLVRENPREPFLVVRFGDHQPMFAKHVIDPKLDEAGIGRAIESGDRRFFATYYALDAWNFVPAETSSALETIEAPHLPLVILEAAGVPLDPSFAEQKKILQRCGGLFYQCANGAEARRFNRLLIDAGLIKGL